MAVINRNVYIINPEKKEKNTLEGNASHWLNNPNTQHQQIFLYFI